ncbi:MAG TPA: AmmeMemoRadiSam system protein B [Terriglobia bacterium]|nr:AmmeMemoRadiSam system protein B [Terriglobia bacterium]
MLNQDVRLPAVAGRFYPLDRNDLIATMRSLGDQDPPPHSIFHNAIACLSPHAGYQYSGGVAYSVYSRLPACHSYIVLGPNHFGRGQQLSTLSVDWLTPLGVAAVDRTLTLALLKESLGLADDPVAHAKEHSLEVQLPFLQYLTKDFTFVPIAIGSVPFIELQKLGLTVARLIRASGQRTMIVASSDLNHYEPDAVTRIKDHKAIARILALDPQGLVEVIDREQISMCGFAPAVVMLTAAKALGAAKGTLVRYATSADAGGDRSAVVGYAGIIID